MAEPLDDLLAEHADLEARLADPAVHADQALARELGRRYAEIGPVVAAAHQRDVLRGDLQAAKELGMDDEVPAIEAALEALDAQIVQLLIPKDPADAKDVILEVKAGEGGDESALFAGDLVRMYTRYAERRRWKVEMISVSITGIGGIKEAILSVEGQGPYSQLKYESGVHRVQRVPATEASGRIHTSTVTVAVLPEAEEVDIQVNPQELRIDVYRSTGPGGQSVNTTDSAVRITHIPTGLVVTCQDEKSQHKNKAKAMKVLRSRLYEIELRKQKEMIDRDRRSQVGSGERAEKIRTYNFPQNRVTDHRIGVTLHNLSAVLEGDLEALIQALASQEQAERLKALA